MIILADTCVLPRCHLEEAEIYRKKFGSGFGFELLPMFDLPEFEENLKANLSLFEGCPLFFHEPVWGVEHTAPKGSKAYENSMYHILLTKKYAEILHPSAMVYHLNNCSIPKGRKDQMLRTSLENLDEMRKLFPDVKLLVENTGTDIEGNNLLDQAEFTALCQTHDLEVLIDIGHANANSWNLYQLIDDLKDRARGFHFHNNDGCHDLHDPLHEGTIDIDRLLPFIQKTVPDAAWIIEYTHPIHHGAQLLEDLTFLMQYKNADINDTNIHSV